MNPQIHVFNCPEYHRSVEMQLLHVGYSHHCHSTFWNLCLNAWGWKLGSFYKRREPRGKCSFHILSVWAGTRFVVPTLGRIKDFSAKLNCVFFFLHFIAMACAFQLIQLYGLGAEAMRQIHVLAGERRRKCCFRSQKASVANFKLPSIWQTLNRQ